MSAGRRRWPVLAALALTPLLLGCGGGATADPGTSSVPGSADGTSGSAGAVASGPVGPAPSGADLTGEVTVLAAASLTGPFTALAKEFEAAHPGVTVRLSFGSSTTLAQQIAQGADADLYASAGTKALAQLPPAAAEAPRVDIARNVLAIATPPGNPAEVTGLASLADPDTDVVLCAATVPCGAAADLVLKKAGVDAHVVSREIDVKATLAKVTLGEADAAIVYHSDVATAGERVTGVAIPDAQNTTLTYPLITLGDGEAARALAAFIGGPSGREELTAAGFLVP